MIGTTVTGCDKTCDTAVFSTPVSPNGTGTWTASFTGYTIRRASTGILTIRACESENTDEISVSR